MLDLELMLEIGNGIQSNIGDERLARGANMCRVVLLLSCGGDGLGMCVHCAWCVVHAACCMLRGVYVVVAVVVGSRDVVDVDTSLETKRKTCLE